MSLPKLFVDTSAWVAMTDKRDTYHALAIAFNQEISRKVSF
jgi:predicted nucleic acid-binding protein